MVSRSTVDPCSPPDLVRHEFVAGAGTAYCGPNAMALGRAAGVDPRVADLVARPGVELAQLVEATAGWEHAAIAVGDAGFVQIAHRGQVDVVVGARHLAIGTGWQVGCHGLDEPVAVEFVLDEISGAGPAHVCMGGAVPAGTVRRSFSARRLGSGDGVDAFEALLGHTVVRSVEDAAVREPVDPAVTLGVLVFSSGQRVVVDAPLVIGRNPRPPSAGAGRTPRLVRVTGSGVSRLHAAVTVDRWHATIDDLGSSNGTRVTVPGCAATEVVPGSPVDLVAGAEFDLGGDVSFTVEEIA